MKQEVFLHEVKKAITDGWEKEKRDGPPCRTGHGSVHKTAEDAIIWTACFLRAQQLSENNSIKEWAEMLRDGIEATNTLERAMVWFDDEYQSMLESDEASFEAYIESLRDFWRS